MTNSMFTFFRKPYFSILFSLLILFASCSRYEDEAIISNNYDFSLVDFSNKGVLPDLTAIENLVNYSGNPGAFPEVNNWKSNENVPVTIYSSTEVLMDNDYETNLAIIENMNIFTTDELNAVDNFADDIENGIEVGIAINSFSSELQTLNLTEYHVKIFSSMMNGMLYLDNVYSGYFEGRSPCARATVGLVLGFAGLVAGSATIVGTAIGAAGFIWASAEWGNACGSSKK